jgi:hypothetical protein
METARAALVLLVALPESWGRMGTLKRYYQYFPELIGPYVQEN